MNLLYDYAMRFVGVPYRWGGSNPISGFDCSGLVQEILAAVGLDPIGDQTAQGLYDAFKAKAKPGVMGLGAIAFYGESVSKITHVVFMLDVDSCIGADGGGHACIDKDAADRANAFVKIRPLHYRKDLVAVLMPKYPDWLF